MRVIKRVIIFTFLVFILFLTTSGCGKKEDVTGEEGENEKSVPIGINLLDNPSFEEWEGQIPLGWELKHFEGEGKREQFFGRSSKEKKSGRFSFYLRGTFNTEKWYVLVQRHRVIPGYKLYFSGYIKTINAQKNRGQKDRANIFVRFYDKKGNRLDKKHYCYAYTTPRRGTTGWIQSRRKILVPKKARFVEFGMIFQLTGRIFFDDVELVLEKSIDWVKKRTKYIDFYYTKENPLTGEQIKKECEFVEHVLKTLKVKPKERASYYYYPSEEVFKKHLGVKKTHDRASWKMRELHTLKSFEDHEIIHLLLVDLGYPPFGLAEGVVFYFKGNDWYGEDMDLLVKNLLVQKKLPGLYRIIDLDKMRKFGPSVAVPAWASFSRYLIDRYGMKKFMELYRETNEINEAGPFDVRFKSIYGKHFDEVDREWRLHILRYNPGPEKSGSDTGGEK